MWSIALVLAGLTFAAPEPRSAREAAARLAPAAPAALPQPPPPPTPAPALTSTYLHHLSSSTGVAPSSWASLTYDRVNDEVFVASEGIVRVFGKNGMEIYTFGGDGDLGYVMGVAVLEDGDLVVLASTAGSKRSLVRCNFRGEPISEIVPTSLPATVATPFEPEAIAYHDGNLYLALLGAKTVVVTDVTGAYRRSYRVPDLLKGHLPDVSRAGEKGREKEPPNLFIGAFSVDDGGNLLFTMPTLFFACVVSPNGEVRMFGARGSAPGKFNIAGKMVADESGNYFLTDKLRSVVMVFDKDLKFVGEFGYRGDNPENLVAPFDIAVGNGKVFVAQAGNRGVSVFKVATE